MVEAFPLAWPQGWPRTRRRKHSQFKTSMANARDGLLEELRLLGARQIVISTNVRTFVRGGREIPRADQQPAGQDPGVAVYFLYNGEQVVLACDRWHKIAENVQAIRKTVEAMRGLERWGATDMLKRVFTGFKALPETGSGRSWWDVLGVPRSATQDDVQRAYKRRSHESHPDKQGGSRQAWDELQDAYRQALAATSSKAIHA